MRSRVLESISLSIAVAGCTAIATAFPMYEVIDLGPIDPAITFADSQADALNGLGQVTGNSTNSSDVYEATLWLQDPAYGLSVGPNALGFTRGNGLNDYGQVVGFGRISNNNRAYYWDPVAGGQFINGDGLLGPSRRGMPYSVAKSINNSGLAVGYADHDDPSLAVHLHYPHAFKWDGATMVDLGTFGGLYSKALDVNADGAIAGFATYWDDSNPEDGTLRAALWIDSPAYGLPAGINDIDNLSHRADESSSIEGINDLGQCAIQGSWTSENNALFTPFCLWLPEPAYGLPAGTMFDLRGFGGERYLSSFARKINNHGQVVHRSSMDPNATFPVWAATMWHQGTWYDLNNHHSESNWYFDSAADINDDGWIIVSGNHDGEIRGALLIPIKNETPLVCGGDSDGNGVVNVDDLLAVITGWGNAGAGDVNGDGTTNVDDLLAVITGWGLCPSHPTGACCFDVTGDCQDLTEADCSFLGGAWNEGSDCDGYVCPEAIEMGACCLWPLGDCVDVSGQMCELLDGEPFPGEVCADISIFCLSAEEGDVIENPYLITSLPYSGNGSTIGFGLGDDYNYLCGNGSPAMTPDVVYAYTPAVDEVVSISTCGGMTNFNTKLYVMEDHDSLPIACSDYAGAACASDENHAVIEAVGLVAGHTYYIIVDGETVTQDGMGTTVGQGNFTLAVDRVAAYGACCGGYGTCIPATEADCLAGGGNYMGDGSDCATVGCSAELGACCLPDDGGCMMLTQFQCESAGVPIQGGSLKGAWYETEECATFICPPAIRGACCTQAGVCVENKTENECQSSLGGVWFGDSTVCGEVTCPTGACCTQDLGTLAIVCQDVTDGECSALGGAFYGIGNDCIAITCVSGACCMPDDTCEDYLFKGDCENAGGTWLGEGTYCVDDPCAVPGDTIETAIVINSLPAAETHDTTAYTDDYRGTCAVDDPVAHDAPDMVFAYTPAAAETVTISLCGSPIGASALYVYENDVNTEAFCAPPSSGCGWDAELVGVTLAAGNTYYIVVDGNGSMAGEFTLNITVD